MSEVWKDSNENQNGQLLDDLDTLFEAASLEYLKDEAQMFDGFYGKAVRNYDDNVLRVVFANWYSKSRIIVEKPLEGSGDSYTKSIFSDEKSRIAFSIYIFDLLNEDIEVSNAANVRGDVEYLQFEIYEDGRLALMYFGRPNYEIGNGEEDAADGTLEIYDYDEEEEEEEEAQVELYVINPEGATLLGVDYSEQGTDMHEMISQLIRTELGVEYWKDRFRSSLDTSLDYFAQHCSENEE